MFNLKLEQYEKNKTDLVGEYNGKEIFVEVKGKEGCINHKEDFRHISERKNFESKDPINTIALLVGNPYRLLPLEKRPPTQGEVLFAKTSIELAKNFKIGLIPTTELFKILNDVLKEDTKIDRKQILESILNCHGIFSYQKQ